MELKDYTTEELRAEIKRRNELAKEAKMQEPRTTIAFLKDYADKSYENAVECIEWLEKWLEKQEENSPILSNSSNIGKNDNVKPKFKVGDWIVDNRTGVVHCIANIKGTVNGCYYVLRNDKGLIHIDNESDYHLWTIDDAKNGDVLVVHPSITSEYERIFIFNEIESAIYVHHYCELFKNNFRIRTDCAYVGDITDNFVPATKEQRNLLFQKMKESGYEWDADKKELKKI